MNNSIEQGTLAAFYEGWEAYQDHLIAALAPLSPEQLALRAAPDLRPVGTLAVHIIATRAGWMHIGLGEGDEAIAAIGQWNDDPDAPIRLASELVEGLQTTWHLLQSSLARWTPEDLAHTFTRTRGSRTRTFSRQWVIWHLIEHDLHHGGEISLTLGMHGLEGLGI